MQAEKGEESNCPDIEKLYIKNANNIYVIDAENIGRMQKLFLKIPQTG